MRRRYFIFALFWLLTLAGATAIFAQQSPPTTQEEALAKNPPIKKEAPALTPAQKPSSKGTSVPTTEKNVSTDDTSTKKTEKAQAQLLPNAAKNSVKATQQKNAQPKPTAAQAQPLQKINAAPLKAETVKNNASLAEKKSPKSTLIELPSELRKLPVFLGEKGSNEAKAYQLRSDIEKVWIDKERHARELQFLCSQHLPRWMFKADASLKNDLLLCEAIAAFRQHNLELARSRVQKLLAKIESIPLTDASLQTRAEAMLLAVQIEHPPLREYVACGSKLGLKLLRSFENKRFLQASLESTTALREVFNAGDSLQTLRALVMILEDHAYVFEVAYIMPRSSFRGIALPSPLLTMQFSPQPNAEQKQQKKEWLTEFDRLLQQAHAQLAEVEPNQRLPHRNWQRLQSEMRLKQLQKRRRAFAVEPVVIAQNPYAHRIFDGLVIKEGESYFTRKNKNWHSADAKLAKKQIEVELSALEAFLLPIEQNENNKPPTPQQKTQWAYSLAAANSVGEHLLNAVLAQADPLLRLSALVWIQHHPQKKHAPILLQYWRAHPKEAHKGDAFASLEDALFSERARATLAFLSLAEKERDLALSLSYQEALPWALRAWMLAELGDTRVRYRVQELVEAPDAEASAIALYGTYRANGERALWLMNPRRKGQAGCVAAHILALHKERSQTGVR